jgi:hypothetical protein
MMASARFTSAMVDEDRNILQSEEIFDLRILGAECRAWHSLYGRSMRTRYVVPADITRAIEDLILLRDPASFLSLEDWRILATAELDILRRLLQACASWEDRARSTYDHSEPPLALRRALDCARRWLP